MASRVTTVKGKKHSMPRKFVSFLDYLRRGDDIEAVGTGKFRVYNSRISEPEIAFKGFCEETRILRVTLYQDRYRQDFFVRIACGANRTDIVRYLSKYLKGAKI